MDNLCTVCGVEPRREPNSMCGDCKRKYDNDYYHANKEKNQEKRRTQQRLIYDRNWEHVFFYKVTHCCVDCEEGSPWKYDPRVLEFDHLDQSEKFKGVAEMLNGYSIAAIDKEIAKCEVVCANHHKLRTDERANRKMDFFIKTIRKYADVELGPLVVPQ